MHRHFQDPKELTLLLSQFRGGEFILKEGRGKNTLVFDGKIDEILIPDMSRQTIIIRPSKVYEQWVGCTADFKDIRKWKEIDPPNQGFVFDYTWFYQQPRHARLKLESALSHRRCWLCSHTEPIYLEPFRTRLLEMFVDESKRKESFFRKLRSRLLAP